MSRFLKAVFSAPIRFYQKHISPTLRHHCIYQPSCSQFTLEAIEKHGAVKGIILGTARICRCSRLFLGGPDPVPETFSFKQIKDRYIAFRRHPFRRH